MEKRDRWRRFRRRAGYAFESDPNAKWMSAAVLFVSLVAVIGVLVSVAVH